MSKIGFCKLGLKTYFDKNGSGQGSNHELVDVFNMFKERGHECVMLSFNDTYEVVGTEGLDWIFVFNGPLCNVLETNMIMLQKTTVIYNMLNSCNVPYAYFWTDKRYDIREIDVVRQPNVILSQEKENYAHLDKLILYKKEYKQSNNKEIDFAILMNDTEPKRSKKLNTFVSWLKDFHSVIVKGEWKKGDETIFTGKLEESEVVDYLSKVKFSFNIATDVFWTSQKYYEMLFNDVVCFYYHYDEDCIILKASDYRRVYDELNLDEKLTDIKKDNNKYLELLNKQREELKPEFFNGDLVYNTIINKINNKNYEEIKEQNNTQQEVEEPVIKNLTIKETNMEGTISFEKLSELVSSLDEFKEGIDAKKYNACKEARAILQEIKLETQNLRVLINNARKA